MLVLGKVHNGPIPKICVIIMINITHFLKEVVGTNKLILCMFHRRRQLAVLLKFIYKLKITN